MSNIRCIAVWGKWVGAVYDELARKRWADRSLGADPTFDSPPGLSYEEMSATRQARARVLYDYESYQLTGGRHRALRVGVLCYGRHAGSPVDVRPAIIRKDS